MTTERDREHTAFGASVYYDITFGQALAWGRPDMGRLWEKRGLGKAFAKPRAEDKSAPANSSPTNSIPTVAPGRKSPWD